MCGFKSYVTDFLCMQAKKTQLGSPHMTVSDSGREVEGKEGDDGGRVRTPKGSGGRRNGGSGEVGRGEAGRGEAGRGEAGRGEVRERDDGTTGIGHPLPPIPQLPGSHKTHLPPGESTCSLALSSVNRK